MEGGRVCVCGCLRGGWVSDGRLVDGSLSLILTLSNPQPKPNPDANPNPNPDPNLSLTSVRAKNFTA